MSYFIPTRAGPLTTAEVERMKWLEPMACCKGGFDLVEPMPDTSQEYRHLRDRWREHGAEDDDD